VGSAAGPHVSLASLVAIRTDGRARCGGDSAAEAFAAHNELVETETCDIKVEPSKCAGTSVFNTLY
jgi:hypothetical protein